MSHVHDHTISSTFSNHFCYIKRIVESHASFLSLFCLSLSQSGSGGLKQVFTLVDVDDPCGSECVTVGVEGVG